MIESVAALYVGLAVLLLTALSTILSLRRLRVAATNGEVGIDTAERASRAFGNCSAYLPSMVLVVVAIEAIGAPEFVTHLFGAVAIGTRAIHAFSITFALARLRQAMTLITLLFMLVGGVGLVAHATAPGASF